MTEQATIDYSKEFDQYKCCVLIPTYNNDQTLAQVIDDVLVYTSNVLVVNDGSTDNTTEILKNYPNIHIHTHAPNQGKGMALRNGFKKALELGFDYVITIDSDGQHYAKDLPIFLETLKEHPNAIMIGSRNMEQENVPGKSSFGNKFSSFWLWVETGVKLKDTQSGYRLYPIKALKDLRFFTRKYEFEVEVLVRAAWEDIELMCIPIDVYYPPKDERISHFRPFKDFTRISILNTVLFTLAFLWYRPRLFFKRLKKKSFREFLRENILQTTDSNLKKALSVAFGFFMGIVPLWGFQLLIGIPLTKLFKLNMAIFVLTANISIPPMIPIILFLSVWTGELFLGVDVGLVFNYKLISIEYILELGYVYFVGATIFAILAGFFFGLLTYLLLEFRTKKH